MAKKETNLDLFNLDQQKAINHNKGPALVLAGAGTGKTAVITARIVRLILEKHISPEKVLALTFTDKAAAEMQQRVDELLPYGMVETQIMTFHSLSERLLRQYSLDIGIGSDYQIASLAQSTIVMQEVLARMEFSYYSKGYHPFDLVQALLTAISRLKDEGLEPAEFKSLVNTKNFDNPEQKIQFAELAQCYEKYQQACSKHNLLDFGDLLMYLHRLLKKRAKIRTDIAESFEYILVDEFQDTNSIQMAILSLLVNTDKNLMVVGDDDQAIYKFRGASVENILSFQKIYPAAKLFILTQNYRSGQAILDASYSLIQNNNPNRLEAIEKIDKRLKSNSSEPGEVKNLLLGDKIEEQIEMANTIKQLLHDGVESKNIAVLLRKNNQIKPYTQLFTQQDIPFYVHQSLDLFSQKPIKMLLALCAVLADPNDSRSLYHLLSSDMFNIPYETLARLSSKAHSNNLGLEEYCLSIDDIPRSVEKAVARVQSWREMAKDQSAGELIYVILKQSIYLPELLKKAAQENEAAVKVQLVAEFFQIVKEFELSSKYNDIINFAEYINQVQLSNADIYAEISPLDIDGVQILTVHRAKGLEFEHVFLPELTEQTFPTYARTDKIKLENLFSSQQTDHYAEERRLFYVAMTRAKKSLYLSCSLNHGGKRLRRPSRFIAEALGKDAISKPEQASSQTNFSEFLQSFAPVQSQTPQSQLSAHLYVDGWLRLSTNQIADYLRSPREFWLFQVLKMPKGPFHSLVYGSAIHAALEYYYQQKIIGKNASLKQLQDIFTQAWSYEGFVSAEHNKKLYNKGLSVLKTYVQNHSKINLTPIAVEKAFELHLPDKKVIISGRYDLVLQSKNGVEIRDFKTSDVDTEAKAKKRAKDSIQLGIYALAWEKIQHQAVTSTSLEFVNNEIIGENTRIDHKFTLGLVSKAAEGIKNMEFDSPGQSQINFERVLP